MGVGDLGKKDPHYHLGGLYWGKTFHSGANREQRFFGSSRNQNQKKNTIVGA